mgnify:FL=1
MLFRSIGTDIATGDVATEEPFSILAHNLSQIPGSRLMSPTTYSVKVGASQNSVGTAEEPLVVDVQGDVVVGASGPAYLSGEAKGVVCDQEDTPSSITFNGDVLICPRYFSSDVPANAFFVAGATTRQGSLAGDMYFLPDFITEDTVRGERNFFYTRVIAPKERTTNDWFIELWDRAIH